MGRGSRSSAWAELDDATTTDWLVSLIVGMGQLPWMEMLITAILMVSAVLLSSMLSMTVEPKSLSILNDTGTWGAASRPVASAWGLAHGKGF
mmetsp:Transcript_35198/g.68996  ORF Transcript_35198/g.68996 Transcript_35198/m.68996 type:complete len:92 (+) Transcript_35198:270-545(+)|eukprot:CAMPEP_0173389882 /NCGR_PEP_ID=MMETSP1356-20130122/13842_1 /TAXON_ID=77927 ORGANISM="Hemiselmis virescens, Strain PCC157" /NCGR_SAMPLE_ID=MMETSP1356 /ASSEMBLY_ACC=CAM_ASM_000847 /LENGTH=91 /DNA_ID=CAMNT_0014347157 /DNA_START=270 /DNA_END=545 /DNA_ORIENTATION=+